MEKIKRLLPKATIIVIVYNILIFIMMTDSMGLQITIYYIGLAFLGAVMYKLINLVLSFIGRIIRKNGKKTTTAD